MHPRQVLSIGNFFSSMHFFLIVYVMTPYLATFLPDDQTGLVISAGAVGTLLAYPFVPKIAVRYGIKRTAIIIATMIATALLLLAQQPPFWLAAFCLAFVCAASPFIQYLLDLLLEATGTETGEMGRVRTTFITAGNAALILAPLLIAFFLGGTNEYWRVFLVAAISITPFITLLLYEKLPEQRIEHPAKLIESCKCVFMDADLRAVAFGNGVLQFFFHLAPFYIPLYLHHVLGMPWSDLGWMFAVMLLPFVLIEYPAGYIADKWLGDKEILIGGFVLMSTAFGALAFVTATTPLYVVLIILIVSRLGSALVEAMVEGHFFRRVSSTDTNTLTLYRITRPLAALAAPLTASIILAITGGSYFIFFITMGTFLLVTGIGSTYFIRDSR